MQFRCNKKTKAGIFFETGDDGGGVEVGTGGVEVGVVLGVERGGFFGADFFQLIGDGGGWISVDSVPGRTVFRISLPVAPPDTLTGDN